MRNITWNHKVAESRGENWRKALVEGKMQSKLNPTVLQKIRAKHKVPQTTVAQSINVSLATYGAIERAKRPVKLETVEKISSLFKRNPSALFKKFDKDKFLAK